MSEQHTNPHLYAIIAGEMSGDTLGAGLMKAIQRQDPKAKFIGIGGPKMIKAGMESEFDMSALSVMGIFEVVRHLVPILKIRSQITKKLLKERPCVMVGIDAPDFNLHVERKLKQAGIKTVHYVSPSVWAWREKRMVKIKASCDEVLALLPFEKEFYDQHEMACTYVGHTLANSVPIEVDQKQARDRILFNKMCVDGVAAKVLAVLPGSRRGIIERMTPLYAQTAQLIREKMNDVTYISVAQDYDTAVLIKDLWLQNAPEISLTVFVGHSQDVIASSDMCLLTSGTVAFEAMLLKRPMVVGYKVSKLTAAIVRKMIKVTMFSLPNLLAKREIVKELIQENCTPYNMAQECLRLLTSDNLLMKKEFETIHRNIKTNTDDLAAEAVLRVAHVKIAPKLLSSPSAKAQEANVEQASDTNKESAIEERAELSASEAVETKAEANEQALVGGEQSDYRDFVDRSRLMDVNHTSLARENIQTDVLDVAKSYLPNSGSEVELKDVELPDLSPARSNAGNKKRKSKR